MGAFSFSWISALKVLPDAGLWCIGRGGYDAPPGLTPGGRVEETRTLREDGGLVVKIKGGLG